MSLSILAHESLLFKLSDSSPISFGISSSRAIVLVPQLLDDLNFLFDKQHVSKVTEIKINARLSICILYRYAG